METKLLSPAQYEALVKMLDEIKYLIANKMGSQAERFLDNQEFIQLMNISKRLSQVWRDEGVIAYSQVRHKIFYRMSDVQKLLDANYKPAFKTIKNKKGGARV